MVFKPIDTLKHGITASKRRFKRYRMARQRTPLLFNTSLQQPVPGGQIQ
jgi:hypothetical protein